MIKVEFTFTDVSELLAAAAKLGIGITHAGAVAPVPSPAKPAKPAKADKPVDEPADPPMPEALARAQDAVTVAAAAIAAPKESAAEIVTKAKAAADESNGLAYDADVLPVIQKAAKKDRQHVVNLLAKYGVGNGKELKPAQYLPFVRDLNEFLQS
jgi:hypothetical protein